MPFDLSSAQPVAQTGFDLSSARPVESTYALQQRAMRGDADAIAEYNRRAAAAGQPSLEQDREANNPTTGGDNFLAGVGSSFVNTGMGLKQLGMDAANKVGIVDDRTAAQYQAQIDRERALQDPLMNTGAGLAGNIAGNVAQFATTGAALAPFKAAQGANLATRIASNAGNAAFGGGAIAATQPVVTGRTRLDNIDEGILYGAAGGAGGTLVGAGASKISNSGAGKQVSAQVRDLWNKAKEAGLEMYPHQVADSRFVKTMASVLGQLPLTGGQAANRRQVDQYTRMVAKMIGQDADAITPEVQKAAKVANTKMYKDALDGVEIPDGADLIASVRAKALDNSLYDTEQRAMFNAIADKWEANLVNGKMPGHIYQEMRNALKGNSSDTSRVSRELIESWADKNMPAQAREAWNNAQRMYANRQVVKKAMQGADSPIAKVSTEYKVNPATFRSAIGTKYTPTQEADDISRLGQLIKDPVPDSGTVGRGLAATAVGSVGFSAGLAALAGLAKPAAVGVLAGRAVNSRGLAKLLQSPKIEKARIGANKAVNEAGKFIENKSPAIAAGAVGASMPVYASPQEFDARMVEQLKSGAVTMPEAAAQLDAYLQMMSQKEGIERVRETYKQFPHWQRVFDY